MDSWCIFSKLKGNEHYGCSSRFVDIILIEWLPDLNGRWKKHISHAGPKMIWVYVILRATQQKKHGSHGMTSLRRFRTGWTLTASKPATIVEFLLQQLTAPENRAVCTTQKKESLIFQASIFQGEAVFVCEHVYVLPSFKLQAVTLGALPLNQFRIIFASTTINDEFRWLSKMKNILKNSYITLRNWEFAKWCHCLRWPAHAESIAKM